MDDSAHIIDSVEITKLKERLAASNIGQDLREKAEVMISRASLSLKYGGAFSSFDQVAKYIDLICALPWGKTSQDNLDIKNAEEILNRHHYGLKEVKDRILEYLAVMKLNTDKSVDSRFLAHAPILFFVGLVGTGKTSIAMSIAEAMNRSFVRIPFGGMGSALDLRGQSRVHPDAEVGLVMKALRRAGNKNPVILLDELDRVAEHARADIMGVLVELLDPEQNSQFTDHYIDYPFDLSQVLFIATANNTGNISTAVMDRLEPIQMPSYSDEEKIVIAKSYVFPKILSRSGLNSSQIEIQDTLWPIIVRPLGFDSGIRTLERTIEGICRKIARLIVEGQIQNIRLDSENIKHYLPTW